MYYQFLSIFLSDKKGFNAAKKQSKWETRGTPRPPQGFSAVMIKVSKVLCCQTPGRVMSGPGACLPMGTVEIKAPGNLGQSQSSTLPFLAPTSIKRCGPEQTCQAAMSKVNEKTREEKGQKLCQEWMRHIDPFRNLSTVRQVLYSAPFI